jgi:hypothetical protein
MNFNFQAAIDALGPQTLFRIANEARPPASYLLETLLPELPRTSYNVSAGNMLVRTTMAGMVGMDSPYAPGGVVEMGKFLERAAKLAIDVPLNEVALRELQELFRRLNLSESATNERLQEEALNFYQKVVVQAHFDAMEWLRGQALSTGALSWTFNGIVLAVSYGVPAGNIFAERTTTAGYGGSASVFWADHYAALKLMNANGGLRAIIGHQDTIDMVVSNPVNAAVLTAQGAVGAIRTNTLRRVYTTGANLVSTAFTADARDNAVIIGYSAEGEVLQANGTTVVAPFIPRGRLIYVANNNAPGFIVGQGTQQRPELANALGYTHLAPTVEGGGVPGRWGRLFTPQERPWQLRGQMVTNGLPVIENPNKIVILRTAMV